MEEIRRKFYSAKARKNDKLIYSNDNFNIAVHVRRGDITAGITNKGPNLLMRWQTNDYFVKVLTRTLIIIQPSKPAHIYIFSQSTKEDLSEFNEFENVHYCLDMNAQDSFLHMVYADVLVTSKSSFSYKPALLSNGIKVCPKNFWHRYPDTLDFILVTDDGFLDKYPMRESLLTLKTTNG